MIENIKVCERIIKIIDLEDFRNTNEKGIVVAYDEYKDFWAIFYDDEEIVFFTCENNILYVNERDESGFYAKITEIVCESSISDFTEILMPYITLEDLLV